MCSLDLFVKKNLKKKGINFNIKQANISQNFKKGTLRGFHFQRKPFSEDKILSCIKGEIYDIVVDLRSKSKTYKKWISFKLNEKNKYFLLVPKGCANAFLTLKDNTLIHYYSSQYYNSNAEGGIRYNDPNFSFKWPKKIKIISHKDLNFENFIN